LEREFSALATRRLQAILPGVIRHSLADGKVSVRAKLN
jgi:hypothetical protein